MALEYITELEVFRLFFAKQTVSGLEINLSTQGSTCYLPKNVHIWRFLHGKPLINLKILIWNSSSDIPSAYCHSAEEIRNYNELAYIWELKIAAQVNHSQKKRIKIIVLEPNLTSFVFMYCTLRVSDFPLLCLSEYSFGYFPEIIFKCQKEAETIFPFFYPPTVQEINSRLTSI